MPPVGSESPTTSPVLDAHVRNTSSGRNGRNRWFDKALTVSVESNARAGMVGEHSPCDALIPSIIVDYVVTVPIDPTSFEARKPLIEVEEWLTKSKDSDGWERLDWVVDDRIRAECHAAGERAQVIVENSDASQLWFSEYGAEWIKKTAKMSPDAYIQMALQLAWYKSRGQLTATYETASTRIFKHGRTDVIRTVSEDSRRFVKAMVDESSSAATRLSLLHAATTVHNSYTRDASTGKGCDRHLMGLRLMLQPGESSPLFDDVLFSKSQEWKLSTSGLSAGDRFKGTGFGTGFADGYGINCTSRP